MAGQLGSQERGQGRLRRPLKKSRRAFSSECTPALASGLIERMRNDSPSNL
jgi:hypothetical protein